MSALLMPWLRFKRELTIAYFAGTDTGHGVTRPPMRNITRRKS